VIISQKINILFNLSAIRGSQNFYYERPFLRLTRRDARRSLRSLGLASTGSAQVATFAFANA